MPVFNREKFLPKSISSVLRQTFTDFELLCINDGSTDESERIILEFCKKDERVKYFYHENKGKCIARNTGIKNSKGKWICFLDSDDIYLDNHLSVLYNMINNHKEYNAFATDQLISGNRKKYISAKLNQDNYIIKINDVIRSNPLTPNQLCYNKEEISIFFPSENIPIAEDWLFVRQLTLKNNILKSNIPTNEVILHEGRTMNMPAKEIAKWNEYAAHYFVNHNQINVDLKRKILASTYILCANIVLSDKRKKDAINYLLKVFSFPQMLLQIQFYNALIKFIKIAFKRNLS